MNFTNLDNNGRVEGFCLVKSVELKTSSKGDSYLDMTLGDSDGEINAKLWRYQADLHGEYEAGNVVKIRGTISKYNGTDQLKVERIRLSNCEYFLSVKDGSKPKSSLKFLTKLFNTMSFIIYNSYFVVVDKFVKSAII